MNQFISETLKGKTYIDPRTDTGFKSLFASKDAIKDFVDGILQLKGDDQIKDLNYSFEQTLRFMIPEERKVILDAFATTGSKRFLNIEMQKADHSFFIDRTILYKAFLIIKGKHEMESTKWKKRKSSRLFQKKKKNTGVMKSLKLFPFGFATLNCLAA